MKIVVDTNIVFSAIANTNSRIGSILLTSGSLFSFYSPDFLNFEIDKHLKKLIKLTGLTTDELRESERLITKSITFVSVDLIDRKSWNEAFKLTNSIDPSDTPFVALTMALNAFLWTGDKN